MCTRIASLALLLLVGVAPLNAQARWTVDAKPILDLKGAGDDGKILFGNAMWATRLRNGTLVIADNTGPAVHFVDSTGKLIKSAGRAGTGPGDFRTVMWVGQCGAGGVYAWDFAQSRVTTYDERGEMKATFTFGGRGGPQNTTSCNDKGQLLATTGLRRDDPPVAQTSTPPPYRVMGMKGVFTLMSSAGDTVAKLPESPLVEMLGGMNGRGGGAVPRPLGVETRFALSADRVFLGAPDSGTIGVYSLDGKRTGTITVQAAPTAPTGEQYERASEITSGMVPSQMRKQVKEWLLTVPPPAKLPAFSALLTDASGLLWVVTSVPGDKETRLRAFNAAGTGIATVTVPVQLSVHEVGTDYILGSRLDADDEPHVLVFRLNRTRP